MKVGNSGPNNLGNSLAGTASTSASSETAKSARNGKSPAAEALGATVGSSAKIDLSPRAQEMKRIKEAASPNTVDEAKVARLQAMIDSGAYKVDAEKIADRLVSEQLKMNE